MGTARYRAIADTIRERINSGIYPVESTLPSIGKLKDEFGVAGVNTVRDAQSLLVSEGLLRPEQGVGVWVVAQSAAPSPRSRILEDLRRAHAALARAIDYLEREPDGT